MGNPVTVYGIGNCDTVRKARAWLAEHQVDYRFHDFAKAGVPQDRATAWVAAGGWESLVNRKGTTWRKLDSRVRDGVSDVSSALALMQSHPSVIKRPVVEWGAAITVGFDPQQWAKLPWR